MWDLRNHNFVRKLNDSLRNHNFVRKLNDKLNDKLIERKIHKLTVFNTFDPLANCVAERQVLGIRVVHQYIVF